MMQFEKITTYKKTKNTENEKEQKNIEKEENTKKVETNKKKQRSVSILPPINTSCNISDSSAAGSITTPKTAFFRTPSTKRKDAITPPISQSPSKRRTTTPIIPEQMHS